MLKISTDILEPFSAIHSQMKVRGQAESPMTLTATWRRRFVFEVDGSSAKLRRYYTFEQNEIPHLTVRNHNYR